MNAVGGAPANVGGDDSEVRCARSQTTAIVAGRVSVIIPAFNCEDTIAAAIQSCLNQRYADTEVIVVDDGSTDRTPEVLRQFGARIRVLRQANGGLASARNSGVRAASGEFVALMDGDDLASPDRLAIQAGVMKARPDIVMISSDFSAFSANDTDFSSSYIATYYHAITRLGGLARIYPSATSVMADGLDSVATGAIRCGPVFESLLWGNFVHPPTVMVRRRLFDEIGLFDESLRYNSDYDFIVRASRAGPFAFIEQPLLRYRISTTQMSHAAAGGKIPLETARILDKVRLANPEFHDQHRRLFRVRTAQSMILAADGVLPESRRRALGLALAGLRLDPFCPHAPRVFARILAPGWMIGAVRRVKRMLKRGTALP